MTGVEELVVGGMVALFSAGAGALVTSRNKVTYEDFENHKKDSKPHDNCSVHELSILTNKDRLTRIETKIDKMDEKLDEIVGNWRRKG